MRPYEKQQTAVSDPTRVALGSAAGLKLRKAGARIVRSAFRLSMLANPHQLLGPRLRILVSDGLPAWRAMIEEGFRFTRHQLAFETIAAADLGRFDLVVPLTVDELEHLNRDRAAIARNPVPIPSLECVRLCDDKARLNAALAEQGFGAAIPRMGGPLIFPYIVKKSVDAWSQNSHIVLGPQDEQELAALGTEPGYFTQEFVLGANEYATHILFDRRGVARALTIKYVFGTETPIKARDAYHYRTIVRCPHLDLFAAMLRSIGFEGICCFNYKERDGRPLVLEINPRVGGSLCPYLAHFVVAGRAR